MADAFNSVFGVHADALMLRAQRARLLAGNLANADTPGYKARDIDFEAALQAARSDKQANAAMVRTHRNHLTGGEMANESFIRYRVPRQPSLDGNTVETQQEHAAFMENAIRYQATLRFLDGRVKSMMAAIRGE